LLGTRNEMSKSEKGKTIMNDEPQFLNRELRKKETNGMIT